VDRSEDFRALNETENVFKDRVLLLFKPLLVDTDKLCSSEVLTYVLIPDRHEIVIGFEL
jgi:hypothetical protein